MGKYFLENSEQRIERTMGYPSTCTDGKPPELRGIFGVRFLDEAVGGIMAADYMLIGAPTGVGKTQLCTNIAVANRAIGNKVFYAALEAYNGEIEDRVLFQEYCRLYFDDIRNRIAPAPECDVNIGNFLKGKLINIFEKYRSKVYDSAKYKLATIDIAYKNREFTVNDLIKLKKDALASGSNFLLIDHAHYFDYDMESETKALTAISKACNDIAQIDKLPVLLIAQLKKKDLTQKGPLRQETDFHGTSNLVRHPTTCILMSPGEYDPLEKTAETYIQISKSRFAPEAKNYVGKCKYDFKTQDYQPKYVLGRASGSKFVEQTQMPSWSRSYIKESIKPVENKFNPSTYKD